MKVYDRNDRIAVPRPNWSNPVTVDYSFQTSIFRSRNGMERREAMRQDARVSIQYLCALKPTGMMRHMADMQAAPAEPFWVPTRWRRTSLSALALLDQPVLEVASVPFWLVAGQRVVITDGSTEEAAVVLSVVDQTVTLESDLSVSFPAGAEVMAASFARVASQSEFQALTGQLWTANIRFDEVPGSAPQPAPSYTPTTFEGRQVLMTKPNWRSPVRNGLEAALETLDSGRGIPHVTTHEIDITRTERMGFTGMSAEATDLLIAFFLWHKGQRTGFFVPSWQYDIVPKVASTLGSSTLLVEGIEFAEAYTGSLTFDVVMVTFPNGEHQINRIASHEIVGFDSQANMVDEWQQEVGVGARVSFCSLVRFATDTLSVRWITSEASEVEFALRTIQNVEVA
ncbi:hypothetical protein [Synechococcus virus S-ESS1]|uniref:Uncharacterized protein n=1 Tax=Synechococcus virus S-ESS1 TaxID=1964565 RepID=A0A1V0DX07_9CAUD|nr:tail assembly protein [Synechococcus virus S-ESS1]ARB05696.1 hypothetical protein [Synechococcus virus S-ESS1]